MNPRLSMFLVFFELGNPFHQILNRFTLCGGIVARGNSLRWFGLSICGLRIHVI